MASWLISLQAGFETRLSFFFVPVLSAWPCQRGMGDGRIIAFSSMNALLMPRFASRCTVGSSVVVKSRPVSSPVLGNSPPRLTSLGPSLSSPLIPRHSHHSKCSIHCVHVFLKHAIDFGKRLLAVAVSLVPKSTKFKSRQYKARFLNAPYAYLPHGLVRMRRSINCLENRKCSRSRMVSSIMTICDLVLPNYSTFYCSFIWPTRPQHRSLL